MAQITTSVESSFIENGTQVTEFRVPAINNERAESNALLAARIKGMERAEVVEVEEIGSSGIPGRKLFSVTVEAAR